MTRRWQVAAIAALLALPPALSAQAGSFTVDKYAALEQVASPEISPDGNHVVFTRSRVDPMRDAWVSMLWEMDADGGHAHELVRGSAPQWSPDGTRVAYLADVDSVRQLWVRYLDDGGTIQLTHGRQSPIVFRWSPDGRSLAFTMTVPDTAVAWTIPLPAAPTGAQWTPPPRVVTGPPYRADRTGRLDDDFRQLFVVDAEGGYPRQVTHGDFSIGVRGTGIPRAARLDWLADGRSVLFDGNIAATGGRAYRLSNIYAADVATGMTRRLTADSGFWHTPVVSPDGKWIAYTGRPAGGGYHTEDVYIMHPDGSMNHVVTPGLDRDPVSLRWSDNETLWFTADDHGTSNTWSVSVTAKVVAAKPASNGTQIVTLGSIALKSGVGVATRSDPQHPAEVVRFTVKKAFDLQPITHVNDALMSALKLGDVDQVDIPSTGDTKVQGWLVTPPDFNPQGKYPLMLEIHGGPGSMDGVGFNPSFQNFASAGFLVLYLNPRGSTGYGSAFGSAIDTAYPGVDYDDLMAGVNAVVARGVVDTTRIYLGGDDGVLSAWVIGHTTRFAAAAVGSPVVDWISFAGETDVPGIADELFARPFWDDPAPWLKASPIMYAGSITTPTLILAGDDDLRTPMPQSEELFAALQARGVPAALLRFAGEAHGTTSKPSNWMRTQLYITSWYNRWKK